ncbi:hypothetical protein ACWD6R_33900 [Streptomyces sp. NPDC005151]
MPAARFNDPELQAIYDYFAPVEEPSAASTETLAAREGLDLAADLAAVRRRMPSPSRPTHPGRRTDRRSLQDHIFGILRARAPRMRAVVVRAQAAAWADLRMWPHETEAWIRALGADGATIAAACRRLDIGLAAVTPPPRERGGFSLCRVGVATDQPGP